MNNVETKKNEAVSVKFAVVFSIVMIASAALIPYLLRICGI